MSENKVYISAEFIEPHCGLGNYIVLLAKSLKKYRPNIPLEVKVRENFWDDYYDENIRQNKNRTVIYRHVKSYFINPIRKRICKLLGVKYKNERFRTVEKIVASLQELPDDAICVLPHIPLSLDAASYYNELMNKRLIWVIHDLHPFYFPDAWSKEAIHVSNSILPELAHQSETIIVHNNFTQDSVIKYLGVAKEKIRVIRLPYILNTDKLNVEKDAITVLEKLCITRPFALWASSNTIEHKNHERLLRAWRKVQANFPHRVQLVCTGTKEPNWDNISTLLTQYNTEVDVVFTGQIPIEEYTVLLKNASIAVCPTLFEGGGCGPAIEAIYAKIPVACSEIPQIMEQFDGRKDLCRFFDPYNEEDISNAVTYLLKNPLEAQTITERAYDWAISSRTWEQVAIEYGNVIEEVMSKNEINCHKEQDLC